MICVAELPAFLQHHGALHSCIFRRVGTEYTKDKTSFTWNYKCNFGGGEKGPAGRDAGSAASSRPEAGEQRCSCVWLALPPIGLVSINFVLAVGSGFALDPLNCLNRHPQCRKL